MKTAISIPDNVYNAAEMVAKKLNISRSELYTKAVSNYLSQHQKSHITEALNNIYSEEISTINPTIVQMQSSSIEDESW
jgi:metal-responsive CopG/Arc/MetJ family transcriptional regulator